MHKLQDELNSGWNDKSTRISASLENPKFTLLQNSGSNVLRRFSEDMKRLQMMTIICKRRLGKIEETLGWVIKGHKYFAKNEKVFKSLKASSGTEADDSVGFVLGEGFWENLWKDKKWEQRWKLGKKKLPRFSEEKSSLQAFEISRRLPKLGKLLSQESLEIFWFVSDFCNALRFNCG